MPTPVDFTDLDRVADARGALWTRIESRIESVASEGDRTRLVLTANPQLPVYLPGLSGHNLLPGHLRGLNVTLHGLFADSPISETPLIMRRIFLIPGIEHIHVPPDEKERHFKVDPCGISTLQWMPEKQGPDTRVRVEGIVTWKRRDEGFFLQSGASAAWIHCAEPVLPDLGQSVICAGRPAAFHGTGVLNDAMWLPAPVESPQPLPAQTTAPELTSIAYHGRLARIQAKLVETLRSPDKLLLILSDGPNLVFAHIHQSDYSLPDGFQPAAVLGIDGILLNKPTPALDIKTTSDAVHIFVRTPADIRLLHRAPFWTSRRLTTLLSSVLLATALAVAWVMILRRKVRQQSEVIRQKVSREAVHAERLRMARQWHDTFEQHFAGLTMQLDAATSTIPDHSLARGMLERAARMSNHSREVAREAIWDLRAPDGNDNPPVATQLDDFLRQAWPAEAGSRLLVTTDAPHLTLPQSTATTLVRIANEAVTNAFKHSGCSTITVHSHQTADHCELTITDDGCGVAPGSLNQASLHGHFGLLGMRERASRIGASLTIESPPSPAASGTTVRVKIPYPNPST
jgi:signal transduction histidine kinase